MSATTPPPFPARTAAHLTLTRIHDRGVPLSTGEQSAIGRAIKSALFMGNLGVWDLDFHPGPPPRDTVDMAADAQIAYRRWLDTGDDLNRVDFIDVALDVLERITGLPIPPSRVHPDVHDHAVGDDHA